MRRIKVPAVIAFFRRQAVQKHRAWVLDAKGVSILGFLRPKVVELLDAAFKYEPEDPFRRSYLKPLQGAALLVFVDTKSKKDRTVMLFESEKEFRLFIQKGGVV